MCADGRLLKLVWFCTLATGTLTGEQRRTKMAMTPNEIRALARLEAACGTENMCLEKTLQRAYEMIVSTNKKKEDQYAGVSKPAHNKTNV